MPSASGSPRSLAAAACTKRIVVGHDYRWYSGSVKQALMVGLMAGGAEVHDIGLAVTPMAYFAQFDLDVEGVAMVTASHNENGWTGIKMGLQRPLTFGPEEMSELKDIVLGGTFATADGGRYIFEAGVAERYMRSLADHPKLNRRLKVVVATGNGTAGPFATRRARGRRLRGRAPPHRARPLLPQLQSQHRGHGHAARRSGQGEGDESRRRSRHRRRRRSLRRRRQSRPRDFRRHGRRHARARHLRACTRAPSSSST